MGFHKKYQASKHPTELLEKTLPEILVPLNSQKTNITSSYYFLRIQKQELTSAGTGSE